jgi:hypothetical protein
MSPRRLFLRGLWRSLCRWQFATCCVSAAAWGCGSSEPSEPALAAIEPICDGSSDVRLAFGTISGFANYGSAFAGRYGDQYLVIDGSCRYWVGGESLLGLRTGVLDARRGLELSEQLHFGRYAQVQPEPEDVCADAGIALLRDATGTLSTTYCGIESQPRVLREALQRAPELAQRLGEEGDAAWGSSTLLALRDAGLPSNGPEQRVAGEWTSNLDLDVGAVTFLDLARGLEPGAGLPIEDDETLGLLAALRTAELRRDPNALDLLVQDAGERHFQLLVRDEPPAAVRDALLGLLPAR